VVGSVVVVVGAKVVVVVDAVDVVDVACMATACGLASAHAATMVTDASTTTGGIRRFTESAPTPYL
jgi:hypothetical protein